MKKLLFSFTIIFFFTTSSFAQSILPFTTNSGGGSYENRGSYSSYFYWSIGELTLVNTVAPTDSSAVLYQGVLQPCTEKPGFSPVKEDFQPEDFTILPNPTTGKFEINFYVRENGMMTLELLDATGRSIEKRSFRYNGNFRIEQYDITNLPAGIYVIAATVTPDVLGSFNTRQRPRHSGLKIVKLR